LIDATEFGLAGVLYAAGGLAPAGTYRRIDGNPREIVLTEQGHLPPSFDGRVAIYARVTEPVRLEARETEMAVSA
jgi:hypothetical protein